MKEYNIIEIMGNFETLVNHKVFARDLEDAKKQIIDEIKNNMDKYLYPVVEVK